MSNSDDLIAFFDESRKPVRDRKTGRVDTSKWFYVMAAVVVLIDDIDQCREQLVNIETKLGYDLHYQDLKQSATRRRNAIDAIDQIEAWEGFIFEDETPIREGGGYEQAARKRQLLKAFPALEAYGVGHVVLETRVIAATKQATLDERDRAVLIDLRDQKKVQDEFRLSHASKQETMLKIADLLASSRTDFLCAKDEEMFPRIGHRVEVVKT